MPFRAVIFAWRRPDLTPAQFREYYENSHMPLIKELTGSTFPISHERHYILRGADDVPAVILGQPDDFEYDSFAELTFADETAFKDFFATIGKPDIAAKLAEDEDKFLDRAKMRAAFVGEVNTTRADA